MFVLVWRIRLVGHVVCMRVINRGLVVCVVDEAARHVDAWRSGGIASSLHTSLTFGKLHVLATLSLDNRLNITQGRYGSNGEENGLCWHRNSDPDRVLSRPLAITLLTWYSFEMRPNFWRDRVQIFGTKYIRKCLNMELQIDEVV